LGWGQRNYYNRIWGESAITKILDELTQAAEIVESDSKFYKGALGVKTDARSPYSFAISGERFSSSMLEKQDRKEAVKWGVLIIFCMVCALLIAFLFGIFFEPQFREIFFKILEK